MENELLKIFDRGRNQIGIATREDVHRYGYWHEAFHCWFIRKEKGMDCLYLQLRSNLKKDYPNLLDVTAAGHLLANETVQDGVREIKEEIGVDISFQELIPLGIIDYCVIREDFIDKEIANVFLYKSTKSFEEFTLQKEEVSGIVKTEFSHFADLWFGKRESIRISGYKVKDDGKKVLIDESVEKNKFVPHQIKFYQTVIEKIKGAI
ncbi:NUDIX hydrolase [Virgibacillus soli]|uniref:NUDIX hydrolase n=1 Tax=Lederbergia galactosidilytica TaxID=217031 RepID=A0A0Q9XXY1_9BACI|nr:NUDIX domain-containing protein [Lederbergia galactosidilytica]KRG12601.1 NUDIX hydrolase [Virgibacillus soli]KRG13632.1 NUDIX hydrolase [Lederbergia galactosidilytica]MBP1916080.1 isopentenyldiphosphate isomerase [Lederbergia galactosidilytica]